MKGISPPTRRAMTKTGTYTGNGADNRNIDIGVDLAAKNNVHVKVKGGGTVCIGRTEYGQGDSAWGHDSGAPTADIIQAFVSVGFQVGTNNTTNSNGATYKYIAHWEEP